MDSRSVCPCKVETLLAYLALHPAAHTREKLAALLGGDSPDEQARDSLRKAMTLPRTRLGDEIFLADRGMAQINLDGPCGTGPRRANRDARIRR